MSVFRQIFFCIVEIETVVRTPTMHRKFSSFRNFPKNATFQSEKNGKIEKIIAEKIFIHPATKEFIEGKTYFLTPKNKTFATEFSERGIFRRINFPPQLVFSPTDELSGSRPVL